MSPFYHSAGVVLSHFRCLLTAFQGSSDLFSNYNPLLTQVFVNHYPLFTYQPKYFYEIHFPLSFL